MNGRLEDGSIFVSVSQKVIVENHSGVYDGWIYLVNISRSD